MGSDTTGAVLLPAPLHSLFAIYAAVDVVAVPVPIAVPIAVPEPEPEPEPEPGPGPGYLKGLNFFCG